MSILTPILTSPKVKEYLSKGERFIKWDDDTTNASPVILRVDPKGFYLYWTYQNKEMEFLDITSIRDTRVGKFAKIPKSQKLRDVFNLDFPDNNFLLKTLTVVTGTDMVDLTFHNFVSYKENVGKSWAEDIMAIVRNPLTFNASRYTFLEKILVKLKMQLSAEGKIPVRNIFQMFPADRKRVEAALHACHLPKGKNDAINPEDFPEKVYKTFLMNLCPRPEIDEIFTSHHSKAKPYMTKEHLAKFINKKQRDSRLNDILFPPAKPEQVQGLIEKYEPSGINIQRGQLSPEGMVWFLCGPENNIVSLDKVVLYQDMTQPLSHYFINSSHNTYLTAGQFSGISSPEMYRQTLLSGCRCVELDCWKGRPPDEEPIITHGFTMTTEILFKDVIEAIAESAFKTSLYPVILSFENHVDSPKQQAKMAEYCRTIFGDMLLTEPLEKYPLKPGVPLPSPQDLLGKILIKNKKNQSASEDRRDSLKKERNEATDQPVTVDGIDTGDVTEEGPEEEEESGNLDEEQIKNMQSDEGTAGLEVTAYEEMSSLVNYIQPIKFDSFDTSTEQNRSYVISSFTETKAYDLLTKSTEQFVEYNKRQMSRIYPKGTRMDSSNYMPQMFWNVGCQMVALNFQTMDVPMQQNMALFEFNGQSGYLLKHEFMRRPDKQFDPYSVDRIDVVMASILSITILSGQFLSDRSVKTYVEVELFGLPGDPKRKYRTKLTSSANSLNPVWKEEAFVFEKILMPELASLRIVALEEGGKFIGQRIIPIIAVHSGYHHVCLRSESNMPLTMPSLFVYLEMKDYVPDTWADLTVALSNPIKFFNTQDKTSVMLKQGSAERPDMQKKLTAAQTNGMPNSFSLHSSNGPAELQTASLEELQKMKLFMKLLKKQEKELKELERKGSKRREELLQRYSALFSELVTQCGRKKITCPRKTQKKKRSLTVEEVSAEGNPAEMAENADSRVLELKEKLEMDLKQVWEEQYDGIRKKKEHYATEQIARLIEVAREKQAAELKALKESSESDTKEIKKKLEAKRLDRIQAMTKSTIDKTAQERLKREINNSHIQEVVQMVKLMTEKMTKYLEKLEEKQAGCLEQIKEKESQLQKEALAEYEEKMKILSMEVQDLVRNCVKVCFPLEANIKKEEALNTSSEEKQGYKDQSEGKVPVTEISGLETSRPETSIAQTQKVELSDQYRESRL
ncbi:1-phosphatidylinositol 4,5-bisphosphate phosphodiesterase beta-2 isoform X5 [Gopherus evgoodei]|uniref:1-phosphatidylinositol 4,5-bisphosphate phosphodiesterase beta-2 isoform X5 n=1 Tax=Gopherus evgoodei TaxID=1825980 RepID=UPI0011CFCAA9|nr:1-phosphatidylinositol 4,5-bisphosphate phosphodiesterase beta-2 isoform X5 [Gopherus evgoodei]